MTDDYDYLPFTYVLTFFSSSVILLLNPHGLDGLTSLLLILAPLLIPTLFPLIAIALVRKHNKSRNVFVWSTLVCFPVYVYLSCSKHLEEISGTIFNYVWSTPNLYPSIGESLLKLLNL